MMRKDKNDLNYDADAGYGTDRKVKVFLAVAIFLLVAAVIMAIAIIAGGKDSKKTDAASKTAGERTEQTDMAKKPDGEAANSHTQTETVDRPDTPDSSDPMRELEVRVSSVSEKPADYIVTAESGLNVRRGPDASYEAFDKLEYNETVQSFALVDNWRLVMHNGVYGWASADYLDRSSDSVSSTSQDDEKPLLGAEYEQDGNGIVVEVIALNSYSVELNDIGDTFTLVPTIYPTDSKATTDMLVWYTSDQHVAIVDKGVIHAIGPGSCSVGVDFGGIAAVCDVVVRG